MTLVLQYYIKKFIFKNYYIIKIALQKSSKKTSTYLIEYCINKYSKL